MLQARHIDAPHRPAKRHDVRHAINRAADALSCALLLKEWIQLDESLQLLQRCRASLALIGMIETYDSESSYTSCSLGQSLFSSRRSEKTESCSYDRKRASGFVALSRYGIASRPAPVSCAKVLALELPLSNCLLLLFF